MYTSESGSKPSNIYIIKRLKAKLRDTYIPAVNGVIIGSGNYSLNVWCEAIIGSGKGLLAPATACWLFVTKPSFCQATGRCLLGEAIIGSGKSLLTVHAKPSDWLR